MADLSKTPLTQREQVIMEAILQAVADEFKRRDQRFAELEQKLAALEQRKAFAYTGIWTDGDQYYEGDFATFQGSLWCCTVSSTQARPGTSNDWQLAVKRDKRRAHRAQGLSTEVLDFSCEPLCNDAVGHFIRFRFVLDDGDTFEVDSVEVFDVLEMHERLRAHTAN